MHLELPESGLIRPDLCMDLLYALHYTAMFDSYYFYFYYPYFYTAHHSMAQVDP